MNKNIFMFTFFKRYFYAETDKEKNEIFDEFINVIKNANYEDFHTNKTSILDMIYNYNHIERCKFTKDEFDMALISCLKKSFEKYVPPEEFESEEYSENRKSSIGHSNEDLLILYLGKHLFWYLVGWKTKYDTGKYIVCQVCGDLIKKGNHTRNRKYCDSCSKKIKLIQMRKANKKHYNSYKVKSNEILDNSNNSE